MGVKGAKRRESGFFFFFFFVYDHFQLFVLYNIFLKQRSRFLFQVQAFFFFLVSTT